MCAWLPWLRIGLGPVPTVPKVPTFRGYGHEGLRHNPTAVRVVRRPGQQRGPSWPR
jgi:hypothetical protein